METVCVSTPVLLEMLGPLWETGAALAVPTLGGSAPQSLPDGCGGMSRTGSHICQGTGGPAVPGVPQAVLGVLWHPGVLQCQGFCGTQRFCNSGGLTGSTRGPAAPRGARGPTAPGVWQAGLKVPRCQWSRDSRGSQGTKGPPGSTGGPTARAGHPSAGAPAGRAGGPAAPEGPATPGGSHSPEGLPRRAWTPSLSSLEPAPEQPPRCHLPALTHGLPRRQALLAAGDNWRC